MRTNIVDFLKLHELLPVPSIETLKAKWTPDILSAFLNRYLAFARTAAKSLDASDNENRIFLDPLDAQVREAYLQHLLIADRVIIMDPITGLHCPKRPHEEWLRQLRQACISIGRIEDLIQCGFVATVPDPCHCGLQKSAFDKAQEILKDESARRPWFENGYVCKSETDAVLRVDDYEMHAPMYHVHLGPHGVHTLEAQATFPAGHKPSPPKKIHLDAKRKFRRMSIQHAISHEKIGKIVNEFMIRPVTQHHASLMMAREWTHNRFSSLNPLTAKVIARDIDALSKQIGNESNWVAPARHALSLLGFDGSNVKAAKEVKDRYSEPFSRYSEYIQSIMGEVQSLPTDSNFAKEVKRTFDRSIGKDVKDCEKEIRDRMRSVKTGLGFFGVMGIAATAVAFADHSQWAGALGTAIGALGTLAAPTESIMQIGNIRRNPVYFLIKAKKHGLIKSG